MKISRTIPIFLISAVLVFGTTISMGIPSVSFAQSYEDSYGKGYDKTKASNLNKQNVNCNNIIINGINSAGQGSGGDMINDMTNDGEDDGTGQWLGNGEKDLNGINENIVNFCKNNNTEVVLVPEPQTGSLTVKKQIFGCDEVGDSGDRVMDCVGLGPDSELWLPCVDSDISDSAFCMNLQENFFDIEVLDEQDIVVQEFQGSQDGTTIQNLDPGTYTVNEIKHQDSALDQLLEDADSEFGCVDEDGFPDGGTLDTIGVTYNDICIEYEDEQEEDCTTNTITTGEDKTCIVKNYIRFAQIGPL